MFLGAVAGKDVGDVFAGGIGNLYGLDDKEMMKAMKVGAAMKKLKEEKKNHHHHHHLFLLLSQGALQITQIKLGM